MAEQAKKVFNDPIHGHIELDPLLVNIIDTPQFQRLRHIKQLGAGYYVYPGASHNRFEHSIGVAHLAGKLVKSLHQHLKFDPSQDVEEQRQQRERDELCVQIAGLCHDLGHGPFSHLFETFMEESGHTWKHEEASVQMFQQLIQENGIRQKMKERGLLEEDFVFIEKLMNPPNVDEQKVERQDRRYLYDIVSNKTNGIDVDKMDYFSRDCHHLGMKNNFSHERFIVFARVCTDENGDNMQICMRDKEAMNMYELFHVRFLLHWRACQHRVTKAIDLMILDALFEANRFFKVGPNQVSISDAVQKPENYLHLTDDILQEILRSQDASLKPAQEIIRRIQNRKLYKFIGGKIFKTDNVNNAKWQVKLKKWLESLNLNDRQEQFKVVQKELSYGKGKKNPIDSLGFYKKDNPEKWVPLPKDEISHLLPGKFAETKVMVFYKGGDEAVVRTVKEKIGEFWKELTCQPNSQIPYGKTFSHS